MNNKTREAHPPLRRQFVDEQEVLPRRAREVLKVEDLPGAVAVGVSAALGLLVALSLVWLGQSETSVIPSSARPGYGYVSIDYGADGTIDETVEVMVEESAPWVEEQCELIENMQLSQVEETELRTQ